jgi:hypothetical protein
VCVCVYSLTRLEFGFRKELFLPFVRSGVPRVISKIVKIRCICRFTTCSFVTGVDLC